MLLHFFVTRPDLTLEGPAIEPPFGTAEEPRARRAARAARRGARRAAASGALQHHQGSSHWRPGMCARSREASSCLRRTYTASLALQRGRERADPPADHIQRSPCSLSGARPLTSRYIQANSDNQQLHKHTHNISLSTHISSSSSSCAREPVFSAFWRATGAERHDDIPVHRR